MGSNLRNDLHNALGAQSKYVTVLCEDSINDAQLIHYCEFCLCITRCLIKSEYVAFGIESKYVHTLQT